MCKEAAGYDTPLLEAGQDQDDLVGKAVPDAEEGQRPDHQILIGQPGAALQPQQVARTAVC